MQLEVIEYEFSVCKLKSTAQIQMKSEIFFIGKTDEEISLVCLTKQIPSDVIVHEDGWRALRVKGVLDFSLTGILAKISGILANAKIGIFAVSTYNTDYILMKKENFENALNVLSDAGYDILKS